MTREERKQIKDKYGSVRNYRRLFRGLRDYRNVAESSFQRLLDEKQIHYIRRGYPDFIIMRDNEIYGFVEVKPDKNHPLKPTQQAFALFCKKHGIPFARWSPDEEFPEWF